MAFSSSLSPKEDARPPAPPGGIPRQRVPAPIRILVQGTFLPFLWMELLAQRLVRIFFRPQWKLTGQCKMRGTCCRYLVMDLGKGGGLYPFFLWWQREINGFFERDFQVDGHDNGMIKVFSCRHLQGDGRCGNYLLRPTVCRTWPKIRFFGAPGIIKGCGFEVRKVKGGEIAPPSDDRLRILD